MKPAAVLRSARQAATRPAGPAPRGRPHRLRLRVLLLNCPSCQEFHQIDAATPRQVFDPDVTTTRTPGLSPHAPDPRQVLPRLLDRLSGSRRGAD